MLKSGQSLEDLPEQNSIRFSGRSRADVLGQARLHCAGPGRFEKNDDGATRHAVGG
jgi:hypothetical protein